MVKPMVRVEVVTTIDAPVERCFSLALSVEVHQLGAGRSKAQAVAGVTAGQMDLGQSVTWRAKHFGVWHHLTSKITEMEAPHYFRDRMVQGIFRFMEHDHFFRSVSSTQTEMRDVFRFAAPLNVFGLIAEQLILKRYMRRLLLDQNATLKRIAESAD
jgi:hypothetical protein